MLAKPLTYSRSKVRLVIRGESRSTPTDGQTFNFTRSMMIARAYFWQLVDEVAFLHARLQERGFHVSTEARLDKVLVALFTY